MISILKNKYKPPTIFIYTITYKKKLSCESTLECDESTQYNWVYASDYNEPLANKINELTPVSPDIVNLSSSCDCSLFYDGELCGTDMMVAMEKIFCW